MKYCLSPLSELFGKVKKTVDKEEALNVGYMSYIRDWLKKNNNKKKTLVTTEWAVRSCHGLKAVQQVGSKGALINGQPSAQKEVKSSMPRGAVPRLTLFHVFINGLEETEKKADGRILCRLIKMKQHCEKFPGSLAKLSWM